MIRRSLRPRISEEGVSNLISDLKEERTACKKVLLPEYTCTIANLVGEISDPSACRFFKPSRKTTDSRQRISCEHLIWVTGSCKSEEAREVADEGGDDIE